MRFKTRIRKYHRRAKKNRQKYLPSPKNKGRKRERTKFKKIISLISFKPSKWTKMSPEELKKQLKLKNHRRKENKMKNSKLMD